MPGYAVTVRSFPANLTALSFGYCEQHDVRWLFVVSQLINHVFKDNRSSH